MSLVILDYGCHSFTYRLSSHLAKLGVPVKYVINGSLESPNLESVGPWSLDSPDLVKTVFCEKPYEKINLLSRLRGELEWGGSCIRTLKELSPTAIVSSCAPLSIVPRLQKFSKSKGIPFIYWLQDLQGRAIGELFKKRVPFFGSSLGRLAEQFESQLLERSDSIITIAEGHDKSLPWAVRASQRYDLLENWANIDDLPLCGADNGWARANGLAETKNILYSGTLGLKHDWPLFLHLARALKNENDTRVILVSSGRAADRLKKESLKEGLGNLRIFPFQPFTRMPEVFGAATLLIAPLDASAGSFCVPSKILSYHCAGRATVLAIDSQNPGAAMIREAKSGIVVNPGDTAGFIVAVKSLLNNDTLRLQLGHNARSYAEQTFDLEKVARKFLNILSRAGVPLSAAKTTELPNTRRAVMAGL
jgi:colanic acid biosynthesis glycosyl transferase WcaI